MSKTLTAEEIKEIVEKLDLIIEELKELKNDHVSKSQQDLADALNISKRQIIRFEQGAPINSTYLLKLMFILKIPSIHGIFHQVEEMKELNHRLGVNPTEAEKKVLDKTYI